MKHTPGEWEWKDAKGFWKYEVVADKQYVCSTHDKANATLISAAPNLLAALVAAQAEFANLGQALGEYTQPEMVDVMNQIDAAIAKATA